MYWAETAVFIQRANLNGTGTEKLVKEPHANIIVLALDLQERRIFWATSDTAIKFCDMDGQNCGAINDDNFFPIAMAVYGTIFGYLLIICNNLRTIIVCYMSRIAPYRKLCLFVGRIWLL